MKEGSVQLIVIKNLNMEHHISICKLLNCRPTSALRIGQEIRKPLSSAVHVCCKTATGTGSFNSCILRTWDRNGGSLIFLDKLQTTDDECNTIMLDGGSGSFQRMSRGVSICFKKCTIFSLLPYCRK